MHSTAVTAVSNEEKTAFNTTIQRSERERKLTTAIA
jgi:hypothetical protein